MSDMPGRIRAWEWGSDPGKGSWTNTDYNRGATEYHRADAPLTPAEAMARCPDVAELVKEVRRLMPVIVEALDVHCLGDKHGIATPNAIRKHLAPFIEGTGNG